MPAANTTISIPDPGPPPIGGGTDFVLTDGNQTINGTKTFSTPLSIAASGYVLQKKLS